jgi:ATP citrate (pro-S)-lyase
LANYGEYSGAPSETQTYEYSKTILDLMTRSEHPDRKVLFIGGGIANFTNVATTFKGIIRALKEYSHRLVTHNVSIYVRRGGPNYQEGLKMMRDLGDNLGVPIHVFGPEMHITGIVPLALKGENVFSATPVSEITSYSIFDQFCGTPVNGFGSSEVSLDSSCLKKESLCSVMESSVKMERPCDRQDPTHAKKERLCDLQEASSSPKKEKICQQESSTSKQTSLTLFNEKTCAFIYGMQPRAVQGMLDFDYICKREEPSVSAMIYPFGGNHVQKFYWGSKEILVPVLGSVNEACERFPNVDTVINFSSFRSVYETSVDIMTNAQIKVLAIIAEGVPERRSRQLLKMAHQRGITLIGPATVGGIKPGCFKIGNTGGMIDNLIGCKLYRPGSVAYVSKSGGMSNELNNIIGRTTDGVYEGVAIGGDRYPGTTFLDHLMRFEGDPGVKMCVLLGEVGGVEEYAVGEAVRSGKLTKPIVAWCIGTCATLFATEVQFGHAGACAGSTRETAAAKNTALAAAGVLVPETFEALPELIERTYKGLVDKKVIIPGVEPATPKVPIDYAWAQELGLVRKPAQFVSTICDDRGQELLYAGMAISSVFREEIGIGGVLSLLWFKRRLPGWACKFFEMVLMLTADHGPAVSGAHNTIVAARAGKDLVSSLASGLLTIGDRFGGALDGAAEQFSGAFDQGLSPVDFVQGMRKQHRLILGIGHKIKSRTNPDLRVSILCDFARKHFPSCALLDYALKVEDITTAKKDSLILNVDGAIGVLVVDLLRNCGAFTREEADEYIKIGTLNGMFVLGRSIGFIGHYIDQKRLKQGLYRHPWDDISYLSPDK